MAKAYLVTTACAVGGWLVGLLGFRVVQLLMESFPSACLWHDGGRACFALLGLIRLSAAKIAT